MEYDELILTQRHTIASLSRPPTPLTEWGRIITHQIIKKSKFIKSQIASVKSGVIHQYKLRIA